MKTIGIYPGKFQPPHKGNVTVYKKLRQITGPDTYVVTTDTPKFPDEPLNFDEKQQIWVRHGIAANNVIKVKNPYQPTELKAKFPENNTVAIYALNKADASKLIGNAADKASVGLPSLSRISDKYFLPYSGNENNLEPMSKHAYVIVWSDQIEPGRNLSGKDIRNFLGSSKNRDELKRSFFQRVFGWTDVSLYQMLVDRFKEINQFTSQDKPVVAPAPETQPQVTEQLRKLVRKFLSEYIKEDSYGSVSSTPMGGMTSATTVNTTNPGEEDRSDQEQQSRADLIKMKQQSERDLKTIDSDLKWKKDSLEKLRKDDIPNKRKEIDGLNKQIASAH